MKHITKNKIMKLAFVCVNYNNSFHTINYIESIIKQTNSITEIIVVDNNSGVQDLESLNLFILTKLDFEIVLIKLEHNLGYFGGLNKGLDYLNLDSYNFVVVGNNDLIFKDNFVENLLGIEINDKHFVLCPNIIKINGRMQNPHELKSFSTLKKIYFRILFNYYYFYRLIILLSHLKDKFWKNNYNVSSIEVGPIFLGYGACYILTPHFFKNFKRLDDSLFLMGEEALISNQVFKKDGQLIFQPSLIVSHIDHSSISKINSKELFYHLRNSYLYHKKFSVNINY